MADTTDFRNGYTLKIDGSLFSIVEFQHTSNPPDAAIRHAPPEHSFLYTFKPLELALAAKNLTFGLYCCLQRRRFRGRFPPQLEGDFGQAAVSLSYPFEQVLSFVFSHGTWISMCISTAIDRLSSGKRSSFQSPPSGVGEVKPPTA